MHGGSIGGIQYMYEATIVGSILVAPGAIVVILQVVSVPHEARPSSNFYSFICNDNR